MNAFSFEVTQTDSETTARRGIIHTPHGDIETPAFVPVGTQASVKSLSPDELEALGVGLFFVNTYHTYLRPGVDVIEKAGGLHEFMRWEKPLITDSGGFQVFSLARGRMHGADDKKQSLVKITEDGVRFQSHWDGSSHVFTPEASMIYQWQLGADIHIAFDDCTPYPVTHKKAQMSMERTHRWAVRSLEEHKRLAVRARAKKQPYQALYGSIQGSVFRDLREISARYISEMDFDGLAIGGVSVGETKSEMVDVLDWVAPLLPPGKPRHLLGVGEIDDIFALVEHGVDTFDCVQPTRLARVGTLFAGKKTIDITKAMYANDMEPVMETCRCYTCARFSRAYIHHLFHVRELLAYRLASIHNIHFVNALIGDIRKAIECHTFLDLKKEWLYNKT